MNLMATALQRAGLATDKDVQRVEVAKKREAEVEEAVVVLASRYDCAMSAIPGGLAREMSAWMEANRLIPIEVLKQWGQIAKGIEGVQDVRREWAKWLGAWIEKKGKRNE